MGGGGKTKVPSKTPLFFFFLEQPLVRSSFGELRNISELTVFNLRIRFWL